MAAGASCAARAASSSPPPRELAKQVEPRVCRDAPGPGDRLRVRGVSMENQIRQIKRGLDVVVGTPDA